MLRTFLRLFHRPDVDYSTDAEAVFNPALARRLRETEMELVQALQLAKNLRLENQRLEQVLRGLNLPPQMPEFIEGISSESLKESVHANEGEVTP